MSQIIRGLVNVTNGSAVVTGDAAALFSSGVPAVAVNNLFKVNGETPYYNVLSVDSDTQITLTSNYGGSTDTGLSYTITQDFYVNLNMIRVNLGDAELAEILDRNFGILDVSAADSASITAAVGAVAFKFTFDNSITMADPGAGDVRFDNATIESVTNIAFDATSADSGNPDISDFIASLDDGSNTTHEGYIIIKKSAEPATFAVFSITGVIVDNTGWLQVPVTFVASNGTFSDADVLYFSFARTGDKGAQGSTGDTGAQGPQGDTGARGSDAGLDMIFESATTDTDQGAGKTWLNNATPASATVFYMDDVDANSANINDYVDSWDDSTTTALRGEIKLVKQSDPAVFALYSVTGVVTSETTYSKVAVTYVTGAGSFSDTDAVSVSFSRTGNKGATGGGGGGGGVNALTYLAL